MEIIYLLIFNSSSSLLESVQCDWSFGIFDILVYIVRVSETLSTLLQTYFVKQWIENTINNVKDWLV